MNRYIKIFVVFACCMSLLGACSSDSPRTPKVLNVTSGSSIQETIDKAHSGDIVLLDEGTYTGEIVVSTPDITIRGKDRNLVLIDGKYKQNNGITVAASGVRIENLTVQKFRMNGVIVQGGYDSGDSVAAETIDRYSIQYVNALNNGLYGLYAFSSTNGEIAHTYSAINADAGIYIGQCKPCNALVHDNVAEKNGIGLQGANASKELYVYDNDFSNNRTGIHMLSETQERKAPQESVIISNNTVNSNNEASAPTTTPDLFGFGIIFAGGSDNVAQSNTVTGNVQAGIGIVTQSDYLPARNSVRSNIANNNGFDLLFFAEGKTQLAISGNCFTGNTFGLSNVTNIEAAMPCGGEAVGDATFTPLAEYDIPEAALYSTFAVATQKQVQKPGSLKVLPAKLGKITAPKGLNK